MYHILKLGIVFLEIPQIQLNLIKNPVINVTHGRFQLLKACLRTFRTVVLRYFHKLKTCKKNLYNIYILKSGP